MEIVELIMGILLLSLCFIATTTDIKEGYIYNKTLKKYVIAAIPLIAIYYCYFARDLFVDFLLNLLIVSFISLVLFYSNSFAGGDCKLTIVMTMLFPAKWYFAYNGSLATLFFAIGIAVFYGYLYLLVTAIYELIKKQNIMTKSYISNHLMAFFKSFLSAFVYISAINLLITVLSISGISINIWFTRVICILTAWAIGKYPVFKERSLILGTIAFDFIISVIFKIIPFSINPGNYILVIVLLLCQMTIRTSLYKNILVDELKQGMILSTMSSVLMQNSRIKGLPSVSAEDLSNRLTADEVDSVQKWAKSKGVKELAIVKKIPFAIFLSLGYISYFVFWSII